MTDTIVVARNCVIVVVTGVETVVVVCSVEDAVDIEVDMLVSVWI